MSDNFLSRFSDVIRQQGEEKERLTLETIKNLENELSGYSNRVRVFRHHILMEKLETATLQMGCSDPRIGDLWRKIQQQTLTEIYRRLLMVPET